MYRRMVSHILMQWQVMARVAANGKIALEMVAKDVYDVVLMDFTMPEMDGYEATRIIRSMEGNYYRNLPIIAFSSSPEAEKIVECAGNGQIGKSPLDREELYHKIIPYLKPAPEPQNFHIHEEMNPRNNRESDRKSTRLNSSH